MNKNPTVYCYKSSFFIILLVLQVYNVINCLTFFNLFTENISMSNWDTMSQTVKDEVKTETIDHVIKKEIKTELEEVTKKSHGFICPTCKAHFLNDEYFIEHIKEHHADVTGEKVNCNEIISSSGIPEKENNSKNTPHGCKVFKCHICSFSCS